jgi:asparagine synthase (glutamine-hydrolysing)
MCGIAGFYGLTRVDVPARPVLDRMVHALRHRGPDDGGVRLDGRVALGHRRLSIIDLAGGHQPLGSADGAVWVSFNGEIFNYVELRRELEARGHAFRTSSDTETIVQSYLEAGPACVERFNGDFAYALWDRRHERLVLARDRMGVRPLYYTVCRGVLVFASEVKALLEYPGVQAELDPLALEQCFTFWFPLAPRTPYKGIFELPPASQLVAENGSFSIRPYWKLEFPDRAEAKSDPRSEDEVAEELEALLDDATRIRMRADVPVGAYLSGGFDSSATTALAQRYSARLRTFSVGFESGAFDETPYQREVVAALGTEHSMLACTRAEIGRSFPEVVRHAERPVLRSAPAPLYALARMVREHGFKVVVTGEGADEVFGGYDIFKEAKIRRFWGRRPDSKRRPQLLRRLYPYLPGMQSQSLDYLQAFFRAGLTQLDDPLYSHLPRFQLGRRATRFFSGELRRALRGYDALQDLREQLPAGFRAWHPLSQAQYLESAFLLPGYILSSQGDRMAMAHGVEGRFPFLDHRVVEFASRIAPRLKLKGLREKHILRRALGRYLPPAIAGRAKQPYRAPESECFVGPGGPDYVDAMLAPQSIARSGYFDPDAVAMLAAKCARSAAGGAGGGPIGAADNMAFMGVLSTQIIDTQFVRRPAGTEAGAERRAVPAVV